MRFWYTENHTPNVKFSIRVDRQLYSGQSEFQRIDVFESAELGRFFTLDGYVMMTEKDEFIYHEMIAHVPMAVLLSVMHKPAEAAPGLKALIIGGGDGGAARELLRYKSVRAIDLVEIDPLVIKVCKEFLPFTAACLDNPIVKIHYEDGSIFIKNIIEADYKYDLIIIDSTDPIGPGESLFTESFYNDCFNALNDTGIMINQHESAFYDEDINAMLRTHKHISSVFPLAALYGANIPTYSSGYWLFGFSSKGIDPIDNFDKNIWDKLSLNTRYYNSQIHTAAFALPNFVLDLLGGTNSIYNGT